MKFKFDFFRSSVGASIAVGFSALTILLTLVLVEVIGVSATEEVRSNIGRGLAELAFQTTDKLDRGMFERYREVQLLVKRDDLTSPKISIDEKRRQLEALQATYPHYAWIGMTDMDGKVVVSAKGILEGADVHKRPWFGAALKGQNLGDVHEAVMLAKILPKVGDDPWRFVDIAFPYSGPDGKVQGVLGIHLSWQWAREVQQSIFRPHADGRSLQTYIVSDNGQILLGSPDLLGKKLSTASFSAAQARQNSFVVENWEDGKEYLVGYARSVGHASYPGLGWTVLVRQRTDEAFAPIRRIQRNVLVSGILVALIFSLLGLLAARRLTRPILALSRSARRIEAGEALQVDATGSGYVEVKALESSLNSLIRNLRQKEADLLELNTSLEKRVETRTAELQRALAEGRLNQQRMQTILETAQDAFIGMDMRGKIVDWNSQAEKLLGWTREEAIGLPLAATLIPDRFRHHYDGAMQKIRATGDAEFLRRRAERQVNTRDGREVPVEMTIGLIEVNGSHFFGAFLHDISRRREVERMKNEFISTVSHELRTPLTAIRGSVDLLAGGAAGELPAGARSLLQIASKSCVRLVRLINDMLDIEQMESGHMEFNVAPQPLQPLVAQAVEATRTFAGELDVQFRLQLCEQASIVNIDADRITQVLVNLLSNAAKFSPAGGTVEVTLENVGKVARLSVRDHGNGIPAAAQERIFQKFGIVDASNTRSKGGTGLGLSICRHIIEEHQGVIDFHSVEGEGAEFYFELPLLPAAAMPLHEASNEAI